MGKAEHWSVLEQLKNFEFRISNRSEIILTVESEARLPTSLRHRKYLVIEAQPEETKKEYKCIGYLSNFGLGN